WRSIRACNGINVVLLRQPLFGQENRAKRAKASKEDSLAETQRSERRDRLLSYLARVGGVLGQSSSSWPRPHSVASSHAGSAVYRIAMSASIPSAAARK